MSYGFSIKTGTGATVDIISSDSVPGVFIDQFYLTFVSGQVTNKTYSAFQGQNLYVFVVPDGSITTGGKGTETAIYTSVNDSTKTITLTCDSSVLGALQTNSYVVVMGV